MLAELRKEVLAARASVSALRRRERAETVRSIVFLFGLGNRDLSQGVLAGFCLERVSAAVLPFLLENPRRQRPSCPRLGIVLTPLPFTNNRH